MIDFKTVNNRNSIRYFYLCASRFVWFSFSIRCCYLFQLDVLTLMNDGGETILSSWLTSMVGLLGIFYFEIRLIFYCYGWSCSKLTTLHIYIYMNLMCIFLYAFSLKSDSVCSYHWRVGNCTSNCKIKTTKFYFVSEIPSTKKICPLLASFTTL